VGGVEKRAGREEGARLAKGAVVWRLRRLTL
jgi:hypothetical protein